MMGQRMRSQISFATSRKKDITAVGKASATGGYQNRMRMMHSALGGGRDMRTAMYGDKQDKKVYKEWFRETGKMHPAQIAAIRQASGRALTHAGHSQAIEMGNKATNVLVESLFSDDANVQESTMESDDFGDALAIGQKLAAADGVSRGKGGSGETLKELNSLTGALKEAAAAASNFATKAGSGGVNPQSGEPEKPKSDIRLKKDIKPAGTSPSGIPLYTFAYRSDVSNTRYHGAMAQDLLQTHPESVVTNSNGYYAVDYSLIDVDFYPIQENIKEN
jgi:hypothetical protein